MNERMNGSKVKHEYQRNDEWIHEWFYWIDEYECERNNKCERNEGWIHEWMVLVEHEFEMNNEWMHEWFYS